jgi:hypothetical protein
MAKSTNRSVRNSDAVFLGWQKRPLGIPLALYNITAVDHPSYGSTVSKDTLRKLNLQIPWVQHPQGPAKKFLTSGKEKK